METVFNSKFLKTVYWFYKIYARFMENWSSLDKNLLKVYKLVIGNHYPFKFENCWLYSRLKMARVSEWAIVLSLRLYNNGCQDQTITYSQNHSVVKSFTTAAHFKTEFTSWFIQTADQIAQWIQTWKMTVIGSSFQSSSTTRSIRYLK